MAQEIPTELRPAGSCEKAELEELDLRGRDLHGVNLTDADRTGIDDDQATWPEGL